MRTLRVASAQLNLRVGDIDGNVDRITEAYDTATAAAVDVIAFPELAVCGYPPEDLILKPAFIARANEALAKFAATTGDTVAVVGFPELAHDVHNAAAVCAGGEVVGVYRKQFLPNYAVFDEERYFEPGTDPGPLYEAAGVRFGVSICEDIWSPVSPLVAQAGGGAELAVNINGSPFRRGKLLERQAMLGVRASDADIPLVYVNLVGGQDELVFDGGSMVFDHEGNLVARSPQFVEDLMIVDLEVPEPYRERLLASHQPTPGGALAVVVASDAGTATGERPTVEPAGPPAAPLDPRAELWEALVLCTRDYVQRNGFTDAVIGLSGGVDSTLVAAIAVDALGADHVHGVSMPSRYSSDGSRDDAAELAANLGFDFRTVAIEPAHTAFGEMLAPSFEGRDVGLTDENLQSRIRGVTLMALSNEFGWIVLTTGNKSESAVGYSTLYGDTAGGFAVIKDVPKLDVYALCHYRNEVADGPWIPDEVLTKPPSAELRPDQLDSDSLPPYEELDPLLAAYVEDDRTAAELVAMGFDPDTVRRITRLVDIAEYKRRQNPPGPRVSGKAFGRDRRLPITNAFR